MTRILHILVVALVANTILGSDDLEFDEDRLDKFIDAGKFKVAILQALKPEYSHLRGELASRNHENTFKFLRDLSNFAIREYYGITKASGYNEACRWRSNSNPHGYGSPAFVAAKDSRGWPIALGRVKFENKTLPALIDSEEVAHAATVDGEIPAVHSDNFEILEEGHHCELQWEPKPYSGLPSDALIGGYDKDNKPFYIGRVFLGEHFIGTIDEDSEKLYIPFNGERFSMPRYDVLTLKNTKPLYD